MNLIKKSHRNPQVNYCNEISNYLGLLVLRNLTSGGNVFKEYQILDKVYSVQIVSYLHGGLTEKKNSIIQLK